MLSIAIVGLPNVGKSTLFNALTNNNILAANYPFATIEPNTGIVPIPDERLGNLADLYNSKKVIPATVTFVDIAGLVAGASQGEGLGNQFLSHIRTCNAVCQVVRAFSDENVLHVDEKHPSTFSGSEDMNAAKGAGPLKDIDVINTELVLADLQTVDKRLPRIAKEARANPKLKPEADFLAEVQQLLDAGTPLHSQPSVMNHKLAPWLRTELQLLTLKPILYLFNVDEDTLSDTTRQNELKALVAPAQCVFVSAKLESELRELSPEDSVEMLESYGVAESGLVQVIHNTYELLGLQSYLTAGEQEVRAWTIPRGSTAPQAAGVIHGDFERGFIAASIVDYDDLIAAGSESAARSAGKLRTEGKDYIMQPGDVVEFRFNV